MTRDPVDPMTRRVGKVLGIAVAVAVGLALVAGLVGATGQVVAAILLLLLGLGCAGAALLALGSALADELGDRPVGRSRMILGVVLFFAGAAFMAMVAAVGG